MDAQTLTVISRASRLARTQTQEALDLIHPRYPALSFVVETCTSLGDRDLQTPLTAADVPDDFFTRELDTALREGTADIAVHSAKDLPATMPQGCELAALLPARDIRDALVWAPDRPADYQPRLIGTSSPQREHHIRRLYPDAETRPIRGAIEQRLEQLDAGAYDALIVAACALQRLGLEKRISRLLPYDPAPQQGRLALMVRSDRRDLIHALRALDIRRTAGLVAIVGCPADAALLSSRAHRYIQQADVVIHDRLLPDKVLRAIGDKAIPVGKAGGTASTPQSDVHRHMLHEAEKGKLVVRLQGGDPLIFAHLSEELDFLTDWNLRIDIVPTLTAAQVAGAHALAPLTHRGDGGHLHLLSGHTPRGESAPTYPGPGTGNIAIYMGVTEVQQTQQALLHAGWPPDTNVIIGEQLGDEQESVRHVRLSRMTDRPIQRPALFLVGPTSYPAASRTLLVGTDPDHFLNHGPLLHWPLIRLVARPIEERTERIERTWDTTSGVLFPSRFAVQVYMEALLTSRDARGLAGKRLLAVGPATADALRAYGLKADAAVDTYGGLHTLVSEIPESLRGTYLYPCSDAAPRVERVHTLAQAGLKAQAELFYENQSVDKQPLPAIAFDRVLFTSGSTVRAYFKHYPEERTATRDWLAVGPSTAKALAAEGCDAILINQHPRPLHTTRRSDINVRSSGSDKSLE